MLGVAILSLLAEPLIASVQKFSEEAGVFIIFISFFLVFINNILGFGVISILIYMPESLGNSLLIYYNSLCCNAPHG